MFILSASVGLHRLVQNRPLEGYIRGAAIAVYDRDRAGGLVRPKV